MTEKTTNGIWVKYDAEPGNWGKEDASYNKLYNDLKDTNVGWYIAKSKEECRDQLCGELIACDGTLAGDIYVYYMEDNGEKLPVFYIHVREFDDIWTKEKRNHILFNNSSLGFDGIDNKYLPELIAKLREIDESKNKYFIDKLEIRYQNYQRELSLQNKKTYTEEELLFLYYMAYRNGSDLAASIVEVRDLQEDYEHFSDENKVKLFLNIKDSQTSDKLCITSRKILLSIAQNGCLKQLNNTSEDIINDKDYIKNLLGCFYDSDKEGLSYFELEKYLPSVYKTDIDILEHLLYNYTAFAINLIANWIARSQNSRELSENSEFAYRLVNCFSKSLINRGEYYFENGLLWNFEDDILSDIENHILVGPEPRMEREQLKDRSYQHLVMDKERVLCFRRNNKY